MMLAVGSLAVLSRGLIIKNTSTTPPPRTGCQGIAAENIGITLNNRLATPPGRNSA